MTDFDKWEGELGRLTRTNPYMGELHYKPNNQFHLYMTLDDGDEILIGQVIHDTDSMFNFYDCNDKLIISISEFDYGIHPIKFRQVGDYLTRD